MSIKDYKVVTAEEMLRIEKLTLQSGCSEEHFIDEAGKKVAEVAWEWLEKKGLPKQVTLLVGKGNNGADAYAAGLYLIQRGAKVRALVLSTEGSLENLKFKQRFISQKGPVDLFHESSHYVFDPLILDGFLGLGCKGDIKGPMSLAISQANLSGSFIIAIDVPSGVNATTGETSIPSICATETVTLGLPKIGLFLRDGWDRVGTLRVENFGLPDFLLEQAKATAYLLNEKRLVLPRLVRNRHKYQAGYVVGLSGSDPFKGAPKLSGLAALRAGAGMVRIFHFDEIGPSPMELICERWDAEKWSQELQRAQALFLGPGLGRNTSFVDLKKLTHPCVIDADLLQPGLDFPKGAILTPHRGEMLRLLHLKQIPKEEEFLAFCQKFVLEKKVIVILKGAPTFIFAPDQAPLLIARGDPGMATAGAGDVLTGVVAALLAQKVVPYEAATLGVYLHAIAGEKVAQEKSSYGMIASDLIAYLPYAFQHFLYQSTKREIPSSMEIVGR